MLNAGREMKRVLWDDGVLWVILDDAIANSANEYTIQTNRRNDTGEARHPDRLPRPRLHTSAAPGQLAVAAVPVCHGDAG